MKAVNLIPADAGRGSAGTGSGSGALVLVGVLGLLLAGVVAYVLTQNAIVERRAEVTDLGAQIQAVQVQADATRPYVEFAALAQARVQTVRQLGEARFDWHRALSDFSTVIPDNVWLTSMLGTVAPGVAVESAASGATGSMRASIPDPAIEVSGCTTSHEAVARMISRMRLMRGVQRVALAASTKDGGSSSSGASGGGDCQNGNSHIPSFNLVVFFDSIPALPVPGAAATTTAPAASTTATPPPTGTPSAGGEAR